MTRLTDEERRARNTERARKYREANRDKVRENQRRSNAKRRLNPEIAETIRSYQASYRLKNAEVLRHKERQRKFGITREEYEQFFKDQNGVCAICKKPETATRRETVKALAVDHCHKTGRVRGLLCSDCNTGIGKLKDDPEIIRMAAKYLDNHNTGGSLPV